MTDLALLCCFVMFATLGCISPFVFSLGYVWVDALLPHMLSYGLLSSVPMALIMGGGAFFSYMVADRRSPPSLTLIQVLCLTLALWITLTSTWAVVPNAAWVKWDPSFKTLLVAVFLPFVFRTRVQIEAFVLILIFSTLPHLLPWGAKTFLTGGGYGMSLGLLTSNAAILSESSTVAAVATLFVPFLAWVRVHSILIPWRRVTTIGTFGLSLAYLAATIGTFARTGLIAMFLLGFGMFLRSRRKIVFLVMAGVTISIMTLATSDRWAARINTITEYNTETSANTRILVWQWAWKFAQSHPFGGGFNSFLVNVLTEIGPDGREITQYGRAFHNIYFAVLGEHGYPGIVLYVGILVLTLLTQQKVIRTCKNNAELSWAGDLAKANQLGLIILMFSAMFIDISFNFILWDLVALTICIKGHVQQVTKLAARNNPRPRSNTEPVYSPRPAYAGGTLRSLDLGPAPHASMPQRSRS